MSLSTPPLARRLPDPGVPFVVYALWAEDTEAMRMSIARVPGGPLGEFAVGGSLARPLSQVEVSELPIALSLELREVDGHGEWGFTYLGQDLRAAFPFPPELSSAASPQTVEQLNAGAEEMLRESLGLEDDEPIPEPAGPLPPEEQPEAPPVFDPTKHMDLSTADAPPPLPPPAPPGPPPAPGAQTSPVPEVPPPARPIGTLAPDAEPFAH